MHCSPPGTDRIQRVLPGLHALMVVHIPASPELLLTVVDDVTYDGALLPPSAMAPCVAEVHD